jgi:Tfp pilus assembly protein PilZ
LQPQPVQPAPQPAAPQAPQQFPVQPALGLGGTAPIPSPMAAHGTLIQDQRAAQATVPQGAFPPPPAAMGSTIAMQNPPSPAAPHPQPAAMHAPQQAMHTPQMAVAAQPAFSPQPSPFATQPVPQGSPHAHANNAQPQNTMRMQPDHVAPATPVHPGMAGGGMQPGNVQPVAPISANHSAAQSNSAQRAAPAQTGNVLVELGAHSVSNFYKGLGGNDVIDHGGIFVATYKIPKIGAHVQLRILLPGDYEFIATGVVQWIREPNTGTDTQDAEPGFGARFTQITPEGRQLVYRYTRNREPMFYDDL